MKRFDFLRSFCIAVAAAAALGFASAPARAQAFVAAVQKACAKEIKTHCAKVTPGEGRVALCLLAFEDKLSRGCDDTLFYAAVELGKLMTARANVVSVCEPDARRLCPGMKVGEGNVLACLNKAQKLVSAGCNQAIVDAKLR